MKFIKLIYFLPLPLPLSLPHSLPLSLPLLGIAGMQADLTKIYREFGDVRTDLNCVPIRSLWFSTVNEGRKFKIKI